MSRAADPRRDGRMDGLRALVTASGQGIGRATALAFAREGAELVATDLRSDGLESLARELGGIVTTTLDVREDDDARRVAADHGPFDVVFNCAGTVPSGTVLDGPLADWSDAFDLNVTGMVRVIRATLPGMLDRRRGSIVNMSSVASSVKGVPNRCLYSATKAAVIGLTKSVAADFVHAGIRCNAVCPGTVQTPSLDERLAATGDAQAARASFITRQPLGRIGLPEEIAALVVHLAGDESSYTTGAIHLIDGGWST